MSHGQLHWNLVDRKLSDTEVDYVTTDGDGPSLP
jgi:hypothetical protein